MWERPLWDEMWWCINGWGKAWAAPSFCSVPLQFLTLLHLPAFNSLCNRQLERSDREFWCFTCSQPVSHTAKLSYVGIGIFTNIFQHIRKHGNRILGYVYLWPVFQQISEYLVVAFFLFFNFSTMWISDFEGLCGGLLDFMWEVVLIHSFRKPVIQKHLKNVSYYCIKPHNSKYT